MNKKLEYVVSGTSYMRLSNPQIANDETNSGIVRTLIEKLVQDKHHHKFRRYLFMGIYLLRKK